MKSGEKYIFKRDDSDDYEGVYCLTENERVTIEICEAENINLTRDDSDCVIVKKDNGKYLVIEKGSFERCFERLETEKDIEKEIINRFAITLSNVLSVSIKDGRRAAKSLVETLIDLKKENGSIVVLLKNGK